MIEVNYLSIGKYYSNKSIRFKCSVFRSDSCHYSDACIVFKGRINVKATENTKINSTLIDDVEDHEVLMAMCNLLKYSQKFSKT